jgi:hypothetical protein
MDKGVSKSARTQLAVASLLLCQLLACATGVTTARPAPKYEARTVGGGTDQIIGLRPIRVAKIADDVTVRVFLTEVPNGTTVQPCWSYQTRGLANYKHPELTLTLGRGPNEAETAFPRDIFELLEALIKQIRNGHHFRVWDKIGYPGGVLGRKDLTGVLVVPALLPPGLSRSQPTLSLLLTTSEELEVAVAFGVPRLSAMLGMQQRFFPTAIFVDRKRRSLCSAKDLAESLGAKAGHRLWLREANVWHEGAIEESSEARAPGRLPDAKATVHGTVVLSLTRHAGTEVEHALERAGKGVVVALLMPPAEKADGQLVWIPGQPKPAVITGLQLNPKKIAGNYLVLLNSQGVPAGVYMVEDGFTVALAPSDWQAVRKAIVNGQAYRLANTSDNLGFEIRWTSGETATTDTPATSTGVE